MYWENEWNFNELGWASIKFENENCLNFGGHNCMRLITKQKRTFALPSRLITTSKVERCLREISKIQSSLLLQTWISNKLCLRFIPTAKSWFLQFIGTNFFLELDVVFKIKVRNYNLRIEQIPRNQRNFLSAKNYYSSSMH